MCLFACISYRILKFLPVLSVIQAYDDTHIMFSNTIRNNDSDIVTRNYINITFVCRYPKNYMVQQPDGENLVRVDVR